MDTIINYSTIDFRFIERNLRECIKFSDSIIVPVCDHLLDGTPEDRAKLNETYKLASLSNKIKFIEYEWDSTKPSRYHHNMSRWIGVSQSNAEYVLFLDTDELADGNDMKEYLESDRYKQFDVITFDSYWYFREPIYQALTMERSAVLWKRSTCEQPVIFHEWERGSFQVFSHLRCTEQEKLNDRTIFHHYSWVRSKEEMLAKVKAWGHNKDKDWKALVEEEFSRDFNGMDFVHNYRYKIVEDKYNLSRNS